MRPPLRVLLGIGLVAGATLALQVLLTRVFAAVLFYHFGFLAISLALLGTGAGAILVYLWPGRFDRVPLDRALARCALVFAISLAAGAALIVRLDYFYDGVTVGFVANLGAACVLAAIPFLAAGTAIALAVRRYARAMGRVYAADLAGAGLGAVAVVPLLWLVDGTTLIVALSAVGALAAVLFAARAPGDRAIAVTAGALTVGLVVLAAATSAFYLPIGGPAPAADRWTPLSRVTAFRLSDADPPRGTVIYDRVVGEIVGYRRGRPYPDWRVTKEGPESIGYALTPASGRALIIGGGGGRDILTALASGYHDIDVIELNRGIREVVDEDVRDLSGAPFSLPGVHTTIGDGRSVLARRDRRYDQIQLGFTDTFSPNSAHAFALTENNLYTVEAFRQMLDHLGPRGVLKVSRPVRHSGAEALRATVLTLAALRQEGIRDPRRNVVVVLGTYAAPFRTFFYGTVLAKRTPFTAAELGNVALAARARGRGVAFAPGGPYAGDWAALARAPDERAFCERWRLDVCPPTDDKPFFFYMKRLSDLGGAATSATIGVPDPMVMLLVTLGILGLLCVLAFVVPLAARRGGDRPGLGSLSYFALLGVGFLVAEIVLVQRFVLFLGFPTYALSVVLFGLLLSTGAGALLTTRAGWDTRPALRWALSAACALLGLAAAGLEPLVHALIELPFAGRLLVAVALLTPLGLALGMAMPIGIRRLAGLHPAGVAWAWGINGVMSVLASVLAIVVAINWGFTAATVLALACYAGALAHAVLGRWPAAGADTAPAPGDAQAQAGSEPLAPA